MAEDGKESYEHKKGNLDEQRLSISSLIKDIAKKCHGQPEHRLHPDWYSEDIKFEHEIKWLNITGGPPVGKISVSLRRQIW